MTIVINNSVTLDESSGLQNTNVPIPGVEDNNDNDIAFGSLNATFSARLTGLGLSSTFATANGAATNNVATLTGGSTLTGFVQNDGTALPVFVPGDPPLTTVATSFTTLDGEAIYLCIDNSAGSGLGDNLVFGVDASGDVVFAAYITASGSDVSISMVQFEAIDNPDATDPDDPVDLTGIIDVAVSSPRVFNFNTLPSGQNLFGTVGDADAAIVVIGRDISLKGDNTFTNTSNTINTSQGGGAVTIGVNNQMFDVGEGAYFTYVTDPDPRYLSGVVGGLDQNEADDLDNVQFGDTLDVLGGFLVISQIQGNTKAGLTVEAFLAPNTDGDGFEAARGTGPVIDITSIKVTVGATTYTFNANGTQGGITVSNLTGVNAKVTITGLDAGAKVEWTTASDHNQVLVEGTAGKFDIGQFGLTQGVVEHLDIGDKIRFEDDGPSITSGGTPPPLVVDESNFTLNASASFANLFTPSFGTDGFKDTDHNTVQDADAVTYALGVSGANANSGLVDTLTNDAVVLNLVGGVVIGTAGIGGAEVFRVSVDANTGLVTFDQSRAVVHDDPLDADESSTPAVLSAASLVTLTATAVDGDGDSASTPVNIGDAFKFEDDGPTIVPSGTQAPPLIVDESNFTLNASASFAGLFTPTFGADGFKDTNDNDVEDADAVTYALGVSGANANSGLVDTLTNDAVVLNLVGGVVIGTAGIGGAEVFRVSVNADTGLVTFDQSRAVVHDDPLDADESSTPAVLSAASLVTLTATAVDGDGDSASTAVNIGDAFKFEDDGPTIVPSGTPAPELLVDESDFATNASGDFSTVFTPSFGADGFKDTNDDDVKDADAVTYALGVSAPNADSGLTNSQSSQAVLLNLVNGVVIGTTAVSGLEVFRISVDANTGAVTLDESRAIIHDDPSDPDEAGTPATLAADLVTLTATATDGDGDKASETVDIGDAFNFKDDGPSIGDAGGDIPDGQVDFTAGPTGTVTNLLGAVVGADGASAAITDFTESITYGFGTVLGELSADSKTVTYFQDGAGGTAGQFDDGIDTKYFDLVIDDSNADAALWDYTFTVYQDPIPEGVDFGFDTLPSGQNLFGTVGESPDDASIIVIGEVPVLKADGTFTNASNTINTSKGGGETTIGINNQMFDSGTEGAYFTYVTGVPQTFLSGQVGGLDQNEADDADNIQYTDTVDVGTASVSISQLQGNSLASIKITTSLLTGDPQDRDFISALGTGTDVDIIAIRVSNAAGVVIEDSSLGGTQDANVVININVADGTATVSGLSAGYTIEWDTDGDHNQTLVERVGGKFDLGGFAILEAAPTPDALLDFEVTITDFDAAAGDTDVANFSIGIDGDLDGNINVV